MATLAVSFREPGAARAGGYVLAVATVLVAVGLLLPRWIAWLGAVVSVLSWGRIAAAARS